MRIVARRSSLVAAIAAAVAARARRRRCPTREVVPGLPRRQRLESPRRHAAGRSRLGCDRRRDRADEDDARRLRLGPLGRRPDRDPDHGRRQGASAKSTVRFEYADESDRGPVPDPGRRQDRGRRRARTATATRSSSTATRAASTSCTRCAASAAAGRRDPARSGTCARTALRPAGWTSADAAGLPILPGLARYDEVATGRIDHALRFTVSRTRRAYVWPARHFASSLTDPALPPMGSRLRLKRELRHLRVPAPGARRARRR